MNFLHYGVKKHAAVRPVAKPAVKPIVKKPVAKPATKPVSRPAAKPAAKPRKKQNTGLHYSGDPGFRIKERPSIEDLVKDKK